MKLPYFLLLPALALGFVLSSSTEAPAFGGPPGGPFSNGSYFPNDGTFSAVVRGENLTGTLQFCTTEGSGPTPSSVEQQTNSTGSSTTAATITRSALGGVGSTGVAAIYFNGDTYDGNSQGSLNGQSSTMDITFQAAAGGRGEGTIDIDVRYTTSSTTNGTTTTSEEVLPLKTVEYFDSKTINGYAICKTKNAFPNQKFQGSGKAVVEQLNFGAGNYDPFLEKIGPVNFSVTGVRLSNTSASFNVSTITSPTVTTTTILVNP
jgi:hypothetical protein